MSQSTPRILPSHLHAFAPAAHHPTISTVRLLGTITSLQGSDQAVLESCNRETVTLIFNRESHLRLHAVHEVIGKVINLEGGQGLGVRVLGATEWTGTGTAAVEMKAYEAVVDATHRFKEMFYDDGGVGAGAGGGAGGGEDTMGAGW